KHLSEQYSSEVVGMRRHLHANPELSYKEYNTAEYVVAKQRSLGLEPAEGVATTGLVVEVKGTNPEKKSIPLRADMDALPIHETNEVDYKSKNPGVMLACGHDVHPS